MLHFIKDQGNTVVENWSFFAKETASNVSRLYENRDDVPHAYGLDGQISVIRLDYNNDGNIRADDGDRMILFFGMRRGGHSYYALDVSNPDAAPTLLWRIDNSTPGFEELEQSWSAPVPVVIPGHRQVVSETDSEGNRKTTVYYKYALIFGAGYDADNDDDRLGTTLTGDDGEYTGRKLSRKGRGLFVVDASTGALIKAFTAPDDVAKPNALTFEDSALKWSVVAPPAPMDSNGDGLTDRVYFVDTGGNVFRIDIGKVYLDDKDPNKESAVWSLFKLAALGADGSSGAERPAPDSTGDRRFMVQPELVRTIYRGVPYDAVVLGSGNRANPLSETARDRYYVLRDKNLFYSRFGSCNECVSPPAVIKHNRLYNATTNTIQEGDATEKSKALSLLDNKVGWFINLNATGEKTTTVGSVYSGQLLFSTYSPSQAPGVNMCTPGVGSGRFYVVDLHTAAAIRGDDAAARFSLLSVMGMPGDDAMYFPDEGGPVELNSGYGGVTSELGIHRNGWVEQ